MCVCVCIYIYISVCPRVDIVVSAHAIADLQSHKLSDTFLYLYFPIPVYARCVNLLRFNSFNGLTSEKSWDCGVRWWWGDIGDDRGDGYHRVNLMLSWRWLCWCHKKELW